MSKDRVQRLIQVIKKIPLFDGLSPTQVQTVLGACTPKRLEAGEVLCAAGTRSSNGPGFSFARR